MSQWSYIKKPNWVGDGKDAYSAANIVATMRGWEYQPTGEVIVAIGALNVKSGDVADAANAPTFTAEVTYSGTSAMVTGDVMTVTLTPSEPVTVSGIPEIGLTIGANTRALVYDAGLSTTTSLVFKYTVVANDAALATEVFVAGLTTGGSVSDILPTGALITASVSFASPDTTAATVN